MFEGRPRRRNVDSTTVPCAPGWTPPSTQERSIRRDGPCVRVPPFSSEQHGVREPSVRHEAALHTIGNRRGEEAAWADKSVPFFSSETEKDLVADGLGT